MNNVDKEYFRLLNLILEKGRPKKSRAGNTIGVFGAQARFNLLEGFPILTTKKVHFKSVVHELLWFISGSTNVKYLVDNGVNIWNADAYRKYRTSQAWGLNDAFFSPPDVITLFTLEEFISRIKTNNEFAKKWGELGEGLYGSMWCRFPYFVDSNPDGSQFKNVALGYVDQLTGVINKLKFDPDSRRIIFSAWHPYWVDHCVLPPCHILTQFNTEELTARERFNFWIKTLSSNSYDTRFINWDEKEIHYKMDKGDVPRRRLNCLLYQRSCDIFLGIPFNISSYSLLTCMVAHCVNMIPGEFIHTYGDLHLYDGHIEQAKLQLTRKEYPLPKLWLNPEVKDLFQFKYEDIKLENYQFHPTIKAEVCVG